MLKQINRRLRRLYVILTIWVGSTPSISGHLAVIILALILGYRLNWSDAWNFALSNSISIETLFIALILVATGIRDMAVINAKLDLVIHGLKEIKDERLIGIQDRPEDDLEDLSP